MNSSISKTHHPELSQYLKILARLNPRKVRKVTFCRGWINARWNTEAWKVEKLSKLDLFKQNIRAQGNERMGGYRFTMHRFERFVIAVGLSKFCIFILMLNDPNTLRSSLDWVTILLCY